MLSKNDRERLLLQLGGRVGPRRSPLRVILRGVNWEIVAGFLIVLAFLGYVLWQGQANMVIPATVAFVVVGWIFSLCLHEFAHAAMAVLGGDDSASTESYLSFNPLHYVNPIFSILLPVLFILLGGIGLPGGAVYLRRDLIRSRGWQSAVSLAGPLMNLLCAVLLALPFRAPSLAGGHVALAGAMAVLAYFEVFAFLLNLLPIPPLDGFGAIASWLPVAVRAAAWQFGNFSILILFLILWYVPGVSTFFEVLISDILAPFGVDPFSLAYGLSHLFFWQQP